MQNTRSVDKLASALIDLMSLLSSPRRDDALLREAGVSLDRALFPLLVFLDARGPLSVAELADQVGRDHTTISRQLPKLETMKLVERGDTGADRRKRTVLLTVDGKRVVQAITLARRRALTKALAGWTQTDRVALAELSRRFVDCLSEIAR